MREDIQLKEYAIEKGWQIDDTLFKQQGLIFRKKDKFIWQIKRGWQTADIVNGSYRNHQNFTSLKEALDSY